MILEFQEGSAIKDVKFIDDNTLMIAHKTKREDFSFHEIGSVG